MIVDPESAVAAGKRTPARGRPGGQVALIGTAKPAGDRRALTPDRTKRQGSRPAAPWPRLGGRTARRLEGVSANFAVDPDLDVVGRPDDHRDGQLTAQALQFVHQLLVVIDDDLVEIDPAFAKNPLRLLTDRSTVHTVEEDFRHAALLPTPDAGENLARRRFGEEYNTRL